MIEKKRKQLRVAFLILFLSLVAIEFCIGLFVHDQFFRPYFGDVLIVIVLYAFVRIFFPDRVFPLSAAVLAFAVMVEFTQRLPLCDVLGVRNRFLRVLMGTSFAWEDILAYAAGTVPVALFDFWLWKRKKEKT